MLCSKCGMVGLHVRQKIEARGSKGSSQTCYGKRNRECRIQMRTGVPKLHVVCFGREEGAVN